MTGVLIDDLRVPSVSDFTPRGGSALTVRTNDGDGGASTGLWQWSAGAWIRVGAAAKHASQHLVAGTDPLILPQYDLDDGLPGIITPMPRMGGTTTFAVTAARLSIGRFFCSRAYTITLAAFVITTAASVNDPVEIIIYDASYARVATSGVVPGKVNATGVQTVPLSVSLAANTAYYVGQVCTTVGGTAASFHALSFSTNTAAGLFGSTAGKRLMSFQGSAASPAPNPVVPTTDSNSMPIIALRES